MALWGQSDSARYRAGECMGRRQVGALMDFRKIRDLSGNSKTKLIKGNSTH